MKKRVDMQHSLFQDNNKMPESIKLQEWLKDPGSFIERLKNHGVVQPKIQVLQQSWQLPAADEREQLAIDSEALIREVLIVSDDSVWMFARTVFPKQTLTGEQQQLADLKEQSLGSVLFKDPTLERSPFEFAVLSGEQELFFQIRQRVSFDAKSLWARRSLFHVRKKPLLLTEVFLPALEKLGVIYA